MPSRLDIAAGVGQRIREEREARGWSLELLAGLAGIGKSTLGQIEIGKNAPQIDTLMRISAALSVAVDELLPEDYLDALDPKKALTGQRAGGFSQPSGRRRSNDSNAKRPSDERRWFPDQPKSKPGRKRREGGFTTPAPLPAMTLAEAAGF